MPDYKVRFCKEVDDATGHGYQTCQDDVIVRAVPDEGTAIEAAKSEFERRRRIGSWLLHASSIKCEKIRGSGTDKD